MIKQKKWYNFGDINHREHGGSFVKIDGDEIEVVQTRSNEESGEMDGKGYIIQSRTESVEELTERFEEFKKGAKDGCGSYADWKSLIDRGLDINEVLMFMANDILSYQGGDSEPDFVTNYWYGHYALENYGIKPYMKF